MANSRSRAVLGDDSRGSGYALASVLAGARYLSVKGTRFAAGKTWQALRMLFSLRGHVTVLKVLAHPQSEGLAREHPRLPFKYLGDYVALGLPLKTRRSILVSHYRFLQRHFNGAFLDAVRRDRPLLWQGRVDARSFAIRMDFPESDYEGDLRLVFSMDGLEVYQLIFVFAAGADFALPDETIIIVATIQGVPDFERVKLATKSCHDIQPAHMLMAAVGGIAEATRLSTLFGLHESRQISTGEQMFFSYQRFFEAYGEEVAGQRIYRVPLPYFEKPVAAIRANHRNRNLRKRRMKADIRTQVMLAVGRFLA
jgi:uncharacterized protein VirK/YbjX